MTGVGLIDKIRNAAQLTCLRLGELVANPCIKCPNCEFDIDTSNVSSANYSFMSLMTIRLPLSHLHFLSHMTAIGPYLITRK